MTDRPSSSTLRDPIQDSVESRVELEVIRSSHLRETYVRRDELKRLAVEYLDDRYVKKDAEDLDDRYVKKDDWFKQWWMMASWAILIILAIANLIAQFG